MWGATGAKKGAQWGADAHLPQLSAGPGPRKGSSVVLVTRSNSSRHTLLVWSGHATRGADADADGRVHALDVGTGAWSLLKGTSAFYGPPPPRWKSVTARAPSGDASPPRTASQCVPSHDGTSPDAAALLMTLCQAAVSGSTVTDDHGAGGYSDDDGAAGVAGETGHCLSASSATVFARSTAFRSA